jgi:hypothetical protein
MRCGVSIDLVSALEEISDGLKCLIEGLIWTRKRVPLAFRKVMPSPVDDLAVSVSVEYENAVKSSLSS